MLFYGISIELNPSILGINILMAKILKATNNIGE